MTYKIVSRKFIFFKRAGFKTKTEALKALRAEAKNQKKRIQDLFNSEDDFRAFSRNILIPEIEVQRGMNKQIQLERDSLKKGNLGSVERLSKLRYIFNDEDMKNIRQLTKKDKYIIKFTFEDGSNKILTLTKWLWNEISQYLKQNYWKPIEQAFSSSDEFIEIQQREVINVEIKKVNATKKFKDKDGAFFAYRNTTNINLERYQIYFKGDKIKDIPHCLIHTLRLHKIAESLLNKIKLSFYNDEKETNIYNGGSFSKCNLKKVSKVINKKIILHTIRNKEHLQRKETYGESEEELHICLYKNHYFIYDKITDYSTYSIKNYEKVKDQKDFHKIYKETKTGFRRTEGRKTNSLTLITTLFNKGLFTDNDKSLFLSAEYQEIKKDNYKIILDDIEDDQELYEYSNNQLEINELKQELVDLKKELPMDFLTEEIINKYKVKKAKIEYKLSSKKDFNPDDFFYADLESEVNKKEGLHKLLLAGIAHHNDERPKLYINDTKGSAYYKLFDYVISKKIANPKIYFHNLKYDYSIFKPYVHVEDETEKDGQFYKVDIIYKKKKIELRDSYKMVSIPLRDFNDTFGLDEKLNKKEAIAYEYYTRENILNDEIKIKKYVRYLKLGERKTFYNNVKLQNEKGNYIFNYDKNKKTFNPLTYYMYYLKYDVLVLKEGLKKLNEKITKITKNCSIYGKQLTISSLTNKYMKSMGSFDGVYEVSGNLRKYISMAITGGRVACLASSKQKIIRQTIADYDAVSLYPSAIYRMCLERGVPLGKCKRIKTFNKKELDKYDYYICTVKITKINKFQQIPFIHQRVEGKSLKYINKLPKEGMLTIVDNITLDDYINFHDIEYEIIDGVYWNNGTNKQFGETVKKLFTERLKEKKLKKEFETIDENKSKGHDIMQKVIKLMLNSAYGKTIIKKSKTKSHIIDNSKLDNYIFSNFNVIKSISKINDRQSIVKVNGYDDSYNMAHIGVMVLSYSKRIMNEVMNLANDNDIKIYYQDTDSMHMNDRDVEKLEKLYSQKYNKELRGSNMGHFDSDFELKGSKGTVTACKTIILGKKSYMDKLQSVDKYGKVITGHHIRLKGVTKAGITEASERYGGVEKLFESLAKGEEIEFILNANDKVLFEFTKQGVRTRNKFTRTLKF